MIDESPTPHQLEYHPELAALYALELCARLAMRSLIASAPRPDPQRPDWVEHVDNAALLAEDIKDVIEPLIIDIINIATASFDDANEPPRESRPDR